jgi:hypothetical protein
MKKKMIMAGLRVLCAGLAVFGVALSGCATSRVFDKSAPAEAGQSVILDDYLYLTSIDGKPFAFGKGEFLGMLKTVGVVIPAGEHTVLIRQSLRYTLDSWTGSSTTYTTYIPYTLVSYTTFDFKPGKKYVLENIFPILRYNGRTLEAKEAGVTVTTSQIGAVSVDHPGLVVKEEGDMPFSTHIGLEFHRNIYAGWAYRDLLSFGFGPRLGMSIIHGSLDLKLMAEAGVGAGANVPELTDLRVGVSTYYGGVADIFFSKFGLEFGGGMITGGDIQRVAEDTNSVTTPYLQAGILFQEPGKEWGIYGQYYLNGGQWHNTFGIGIKWHGW